jgi:predicted RNA-binding protein with RPS1 domain
VSNDPSLDNAAGENAGLVIRGGRKDPRAAFTGEHGSCADRRRVRSTLGRRATKVSRRRSVPTDICVGDGFDGTVVAIQPYGLFVDIGPSDGLVHISTMASWGEPGALGLDLDDPMPVRVTAADADAGRLGLAIADAPLTRSPTEASPVRQETQTP